MLLSMPDAAPRPGLRSRTRQAVRAEISAQAMQLFLEHGYDATTVDQVAEAVGISRRSLFRYFPSKEDLVLGDLSELGEEVAEELRRRPASEPPWEALGHALRVLQRDISPETGLRISTMLLHNPTLRARRIEKYARWHALLVPEIQHRLESSCRPGPDVRAEAIVSCALTCLEIATVTWTRSGGRDEIEEIFESAANAIRDALRAS